MNVNRSICLYCGGCVAVCPQKAIELKETVLTIDPGKCNECGICYQFCPAGALVRGGSK